MILVHCEVPKCTASYKSNTNTGVDRELRIRGWGVRDGLMHCPQCAPQFVAVPKPPAAVHYPEPQCAQD